MEKSRCRLSGVIKSAFDAVMSAIRGVDPKIGMIPELKKAMELIGSFIDLLPSSTPTNIITEILSFLERVQGWIKRFRGDPWYETWIESTTKDGEMAYEIIHSVCKLSNQLRSGLRLDDVELNEKALYASYCGFLKEIVSILEIQLEEKEGAVTQEGDIKKKGDTKRKRHLHHHSHTPQSKKIKRTNRGTMKRLGSVEMLTKLQCQAELDIISTSTPWHIPLWKIRLLEILGEGSFGTLILAKYNGKYAVLEGAKWRFAPRVKAIRECKKLKDKLTILISLQHQNLARIYGGALNMKVFFLRQYCFYGTLRAIIRKSNNSNSDIGHGGDLYDIENKGRREKEGSCACDAKDDNTVSTSSSSSSSSSSSPYRITDAHRCSWIRGLASGLACLHARNILHYNVNSKNVLIDECGIAKWSGYGIPPKTTGMKQERLHDVLRWSAPEVLFKGVYTYQSDLWGLGLVVYELIEGKEPFHTVLPEELKSAVRASHLDFTERTGNAPRILIRVMQKCLAVEPGARPRALDVYDNISQHLPRGTKKKTISTISLASSRFAENKT
eukprot:jgi/Bigna1/129645/aug1.9_g4353